MTTVVAVVVGLLLTVATVVGITRSVSSNDHRTLPASSQVQLYGSH